MKANEFLKERLGADKPDVLGLTIARLMEEYAIYQLQQHMQKEGQVRPDIINKIKELKNDNNSL